MDTLHHLQNTRIHFKKWSGKAFAIFASLGKDIKICRISVRMCKTSILKLKNFSIYVFGELLLSIEEYLGDIDNDIFAENMEEMSLCVNAINKNDSYYLKYRIGKQC